MQIIVPVSDHHTFGEWNMRRYTIFFIALLSALIIANCNGVQNLPSDITGQATALASTVEAAGNTVQTFLTAPSGQTPTPAPTLDLTTVCIPPLRWEVLTDISLPNNLRVSAMGQWATLSDDEYKAKSIVQVPETSSTPFAEQGVNVELIYSCGAVYINPDSK